MESERNVLVDDSGDHRYFAIVPQVVWALCRDVYDFSLWHVVKMIAGEDGECFLSRKQLAALSMMSTGKVSDCRDYLLSAGLLQGELRRDAGYPQAVWHLSVPNLWKRNLEWRETLGNKLDDRVALKRAQKEPSPDDTPREPSPDGTGGMPPGDGWVSPGDTKENQKVEPHRNQKENQLTTSGSGLIDSPEAEYLTDTGEAAIQRLQETGIPATSRKGTGARDAVLAAIAGGWSEAEALDAVEGWLAYAASARGATIDHAGFFTASRICKRIWPPSEAAVPESLSRDEKAWAYVEEVMAERGVRT